MAVAGASGADATELVFGVHAVRHALERGRQSILELWIQDNKQSAAQMRDILESARAMSVAIRAVPREQLDRETGFGRHQGLALLRRGGVRRPQHLEELLSHTGANVPLLLVLDGVQDPRNLGACVRTADAAGADAVIIPKDRAAPMTAVARKVASGAAEGIPVITVTNLARALRAIRAAGIWVIGTAETADKSLYDIDLTIPTALVMGGEERGLRRNIRGHCDHLAGLPMQGVVESLNIAVAAGICLYEAMRQRRARS